MFFFILISISLSCSCHFLPPAQAATEGQPFVPQQPALTNELRPLDRANEVDLDAPVKVSVDYFKGYLTDINKILASPLHADTGDWLKFGGVVAITGGLLLADSHIRDVSQRNQSSISSTFASAGQILGNPLYTLPPIASLYLYGHLYGDSTARKTSLLAVESLVISTAMTEVLKVSFHRSRPNSGASQYDWKGPQFNLKNLSFCSGHTSSAFALATVFAEQYKDSAYVPAVAYGLATLAGLSRVYDNKHWASDVFVGATLGYFVGKSVVNYHSGTRKNKTNVKITPEFGPFYNGIMVTYTWNNKNYP